ncbi:uncharacterized protein METZ01_LOCUS282528, partial [marine metagenome]
MKAYYLLPAFLAGLFSAQIDSKAQDRPSGQANIRELFLKEFDKNKDGKLDESERPSREQMQEFFQRQQGNTPSRPGAGGGRPGGGEGGRPSGGSMRELMLKEFDKNGDGQLDENERPSREQAQEFSRRQQGNTPSAPGQAQQPSESRLAQILKRFPQADTDKDGKLTAKEFEAARKQFRQSRQGNARPAAAAKTKVNSIFNTEEILDENTLETKT